MTQRHKICPRILVKIQDIFEEEKMTSLDICCDNRVVNILFIIIMDDPEVHTIEHHPIIIIICITRIILILIIFRIIIILYLVMACTRGPLSSQSGEQSISL